jgi:hypothetical protein
MLAEAFPASARVVSCAVSVDIPRPAVGSMVGEGWEEGWVWVDGGASEKSICQSMHDLRLKETYADTSDTT